MKTSITKITILISLASSLFAQPECKEIQKEMKKLYKLQEDVQKKIEESKKLLAKLEGEKKFLQDLNQSLNKQIKQIQSKRIKKLAKDFENMDPEYAGEKFSNMDDPSIAAHILYNMNPRKAGEALNFIDPKILNKITKILTKLKHEKKSNR